MAASAKPATLLNVLHAFLDTFSLGFSVFTQQEFVEMGNGINLLNNVMMVTLIPTMDVIPIVRLKKALFAFTEKNFFQAHRSANTTAQLQLNFHHCKSNRQRIFYMCFLQSNHRN
jgi:hypothetical protein